MIDKTKLLLVIVLAIILIYYINPNIFPQTSEKNSESFDTLAQNLGPKSSNDDDKEDLNIPVTINNATYGDNYFLEDGGNGTLGLTSAMCSKSCCSPQYPLPFSIDSDKMLCNSEEKYISSSYTCNNGWQDTGCLCMTKEQANFLGSRGKNA
jgi:hypothetical protein